MAAATRWEEPDAYRHDSDFAKHNPPALPAGPCDCSVARVDELELKVKQLRADLVAYSAARREVSACYEQEADALASLSLAVGEIRRAHLSFLSLFGQVGVMDAAKQLHDAIDAAARLADLGPA